MANDRRAIAGRAAGGSRRAGAGNGSGVSPKGQGRVSRTQGSAREASLVDRIERFLQQLPGCLVRKTHGSAYSAGVGDLVGCYRGRYFEIEVKRPGERPTALQLAHLDDVRRAGGLAWWTDDYAAIVGYFTMTT